MEGLCFVYFVGFRKVTNMILGASDFGVQIATTPKQATACQASKSSNPGSPHLDVSSDWLMARSSSRATVSAWSLVPFYGRFTCTPLKLTASSPLKMGLCPKRERSVSLLHQFLGGELLVLGRLHVWVLNMKDVKFVFVTESTILYRYINSATSSVNPIVRSL